MTEIELEGWVLRIVEAVSRGTFSEDGRIELKSRWLPPVKAARRIAAHGNAALADSILWLIGVDEKVGVVGAEPAELADWWSSVRALFDGVAPTLTTSLTLPIKEATVVALLFDVARRPFVVRNPSFGAVKGEVVAYEIPWRDGTQTRTARREEIVRLLEPLLHCPDVEARRANVAVVKSPPEKQSGRFGPRVTGSEDTDQLLWRIEANLYITPRGQSRIVIPNHRCSLFIEIPGFLLPTGAGNVSLSAPWRLDSTGIVPASHTIHSTRDEVIIEGPGAVNVLGEYRNRGVPADLSLPLLARLELQPAGTRQTIRTEIELLRVPSPHAVALWQAGS